MSKEEPWQREERRTRGRAEIWENEARDRSESTRERKQKTLWDIENEREPWGWERTNSHETERTKERTTERERNRKKNRREMRMSLSDLLDQNLEGCRSEITSNTHKRKINSIQHTHNEHCDITEVKHLLRKRKQRKTGTNQQTQRKNKIHTKLRREKMQEIQRSKQQINIQQHQNRTASSWCKAMQRAMNWLTQLTFVKSLV